MWGARRERYNEKALGVETRQDSQELFEAMSWPTENYFKKNIFWAIFDSDNRRKWVGFNPEIFETFSYNKDISNVIA